MINYSPLEDLLHFDFAQMRAKSHSSGACATDEAITFFVTSLHTFYAQFTQKPAAEVLAKYQQLMGKILKKINDSELTYYRVKYNQEYPNDKELITAAIQAQEIPNIAGIRKRMQFWAATEWGNPIRNSKTHVQVVEKMELWDRWLASSRLSYKRSRDNDVAQTSETLPQTQESQIQAQYSLAGHKQKFVQMLTSFSLSNTEHLRIIDLLNRAIATIDYVEMDPDLVSKSQGIESLIITTAFDYCQHLIPLICNELHRLKSLANKYPLSFFDPVASKTEGQDRSPEQNEAKKARFHDNKFTLLH